MKQMDIEIRMSRPSDSEKLAKFISRQIGTQVSADYVIRMEQALSNSGIWKRLVPVFHGQILGSAQIGDEPALPAGYLATHVAVDPSVRKNGYGGLLWTSLQQIIDEHPSKGLQATVKDTADAEKEWKGYLTVRNLKSLCDFGQIQRTS